MFTSPNATFRGVSPPLTPNPATGSPPLIADNSEQAISAASSNSPQSPLAFALEEGDFQNALTLLENNCELDLITAPDQWWSKVISNLHQQLESINTNTGLMPSETAIALAQESHKHPQISLMQAHHLLHQLNNQNSIVLNQRHLITNLFRQALKDKNTDIAYLYLDLDFLDAISFNTCNSPFQPTLVHLAMEQNLPEIAIKCLEKGADLHQLTSRQENLLILSVRLNQPTMILYLIAHNIDINAKDFHEENALHQAIRRHFPDIVKMLLEHDIQINAVTAEGDTPLHLAIEQKNETILNELLAHHADPGFPNSLGQLPLELAILQDSPNLVQILLNHNVPQDIRDESGRNILQIARAANARHVLPLLLQTNALRFIRNDPENTHDSVVNQGFARIYQDLQKAIPPHKVASFDKVERVLRQYLTQQRQFTALRTLETIKNEGSIEFAHLASATEQDIISLIWSLIAQPFVLNQAQPSDSNQMPASIAAIDKNLLKQNLVHRLQDAWNPETQATVCPSGRVNRLLDVFTGLYTGGWVLSKDILQREMLDKASQLRNNFYEASALFIPPTNQMIEALPMQNHASQSEKKGDEHSLKAYIRKNLAHDYVKTGIITQSLFDQILNEWIEFIE